MSRVEWHLLDFEAQGKNGLAFLILVGLEFSELFLGEA
jgi:hypothetical protein